MGIEAFPLRKSDAHVRVRFMASASADRFHRLDFMSAWTLSLSSFSASATLKSLA